MINRLVMPNIISLYWIMTDSKFLLIFNGKNSDPLNHLFSTMWAEFIIPSVVVAPSLWRIQTSRHTFATFLSFSILFYEMSTAFLFYSMIRRHFQVASRPNYSDHAKWICICYDTARLAQVNSTGETQLQECRP